MRTRPTIKKGCEWIAMNDNEGAGDREADIAGYVSTCLLADLFGTDRAKLAKTIATIRRNLGYAVGEPNEAFVFVRSSDQPKPSSDNVWLMGVVVGPQAQAEAEQAEEAKRRG